MLPIKIPSPLRTISTCFNRSPGRRSSAFFPLFRIAMNSDAHVFLIKPRAVTITRCGSLSDPEIPSSALDTGSMAVMFSPSVSFNTRVNGVPNAVVDASGIVYALTACTRPRSVKNNTVSNPPQCVALVTSSPPRIFPMFFPRVARFCFENVEGSMRLMYPRLVMITRLSLFKLSTVTLFLFAKRVAASRARSRSVPDPPEESLSSSSSPSAERLAAASAAVLSMAVRRSMPNILLNSSASSMIVAITRPVSPSNPVKSLTFALNSVSSAFSLSRSSPVSRRSGIARIASACFSLSQNGFSQSASCAALESGAALIAATTASGAACTAR
mmetsp:Transcript_13395/g.50151  ORF Transcript_13395/g.50151 Transcript_13395/m.50151 type:complete len:329 (-) Transcript_13395:2412-3398(-)